MTVWWGWALGCFVCGLPCLLPKDHTGALVAHTCQLPTCRCGLCGGVISAWGRDLPPLPWNLERDTVDRGVSANERQDIGVLQLSFFLWETEDQSRERSCPGFHIQPGQSWE